MPGGSARALAAASTSPLTLGSPCLQLKICAANAILTLAAELIKSAGVTVVRTPRVCALAMVSLAISSFVAWLSSANSLNGKESSRRCKIL
jgi:hypothetical protein